MNVVGGIPIAHPDRAETEGTFSQCGVSEKYSSENRESVIDYESPKTSSEESPTLADEDVPIQNVESPVSRAAM